MIQLINTFDGKPFSEVAEEGLLGLTQTLGVAFAQRVQSQSGLRSRYESLVADKRISADDLAEASRTARQTGIRTEDVLIAEYGLQLSEIGEALARFYNTPYEPFHPDRVKPLDLLRHIKREYVEQSHWLPLEETNEGILIMTVDPEQVQASRIAHNVFPKGKFVYRVTTYREFAQTIDQFFAMSLDLGSVDDILSDMGEDEYEGTSTADDVSAAADNELVKLVNKIIIDAYKQGASDIHIEPRPGKEKTRIRFRRDGSLVPYIEVPASYRSPLVTRLKIMCDLDISERRKPQDGKIKFRKYAPLDIELRVATVPTAGGVEDVVMRILANSEPIKIDELGLLGPNLERLKQAIQKPYGIFFVCGPTGSGKTTTLHSILGYINTPTPRSGPPKIPSRSPRRAAPGAGQSQGRARLSDRDARLPACRPRCDHGRRDARQGDRVDRPRSLAHRPPGVLHPAYQQRARVHRAPARHGHGPFNFADALLGVLAQRLAKRLCKNARRPTIPRRPGEQPARRILRRPAPHPVFREDPAAARAAILEGWRERYGDKQGRFTLYKPVGCDECTKGYKGRLGLHELMLGSDEVKRLIQERARVADLLTVALAEDMRTLRQDGIEKVFSGITDMAQVRKVCVR